MSKLKLNHQYYHSISLQNILLLCLVVSIGVNVYFYSRNDEVNLSTKSSDIRERQLNLSMDREVYKSVLGITISYPTQLLNVLSWEPDPGDESILDNFVFTDDLNGEGIIEGSLWNETQQSGIDKETDFVEANELKLSDIKTNASGNIYTKTSAAIQEYYYIDSIGRKGDLLVLRLIQLEPFEEYGEIKSILQSVEMNLN